MKRKKENLFRRIMAMLLVTVLVVGTTQGAVPVNVSAQEGSVSGNSAEESGYTLTDQDAAKVFMTDTNLQSKLDNAGNSVVLRVVHQHGVTGDSGTQEVFTELDDNTATLSSGSYYLADGTGHQVWLTYQSSADKVAAAMNVVNWALIDYTADNNVTKEDIQTLLDTALSEEGITDVTVRVVYISKTEATTSKEGWYGKDGSGGSVSGHNGGQ